MFQILIRRGVKVRAVYQAEPDEKGHFRRVGRLLARLERRAAAAAGVADAAHGFVANRSPVTCAARHVGATLTVSVDLQSWYDSVSATQVAEGLRLAGMDLTRAGLLAVAACRTASPPSPNPDRLAPRQGLSSSPAAANLAAVRLDRLVIEGLGGLGLKFAYTRYADDCIVSVFGDDTRAAADRILGVLNMGVADMGWSLAPRKTRIQRGSAGRRVVVGVSVGPDGLGVTRKTRRRLRAGLHKAPDAARTRGLAEWCKLKTPKCDHWADVAAILGHGDVPVAADRLRDAGLDADAVWLEREKRADVLLAEAKRRRQQ